MKESSSNFLALDLCREKITTWNGLQGNESIHTWPQLGWNRARAFLTQEGAKLQQVGLRVLVQARRAAALEVVLVLLQKGDLL